MSRFGSTDETSRPSAAKFVAYCLCQPATDALFDLGQTQVSTGALSALAANGLSADPYFMRHAAGDWGEAEEFDRTGNAFAVEHGITRFIIQSLYVLPDQARLLVVTTTDRTRTGMLLDQEFEDREISTLEGYARWAHQYDREVNPLIAIETPYVEQILAQLPITKALDAATGTGRHALRLAERGVQVVAIDQSPEMLAEARLAATRQGVTIDFRFATLEESLPLADAQFDLVVCALALGHVVHLHGAVAEFARLLKPGGALVVTDFHPYCVSQGWRAALFEPDAALLFCYPGHSRDDYLTALNDAGLQVIRTVDATMGEAPPGTMLDEEREGGKEIPFCFVVLASKPAEAD